MEVSLASEQVGAWRLRLNLDSGWGFEGGHSENKGLSPGGDVITVPEHRHKVEVDLWRAEFVAAYTFTENWDAWLRLPFERKIRTASIELVEPATQAEQDAMQRNLDIHHASATLEGLSDPSLLAATRSNGLFTESDVVAFAFGTSIPLGQTEENPYLLGDAGEAHEHMQFGTGTFTPLLEAFYVTPVSEDTSFSASLVGKAPLYESSKGYKGSTEVSAGVNLLHSLDPNWRVRVGWSSFYQDFAKWDGGRDPNSGLISHGATMGVTYDLGKDWDLSLDVRLPISQRALDEHGDTYEHGPMVRLGLSRSIGP